MRIFCLMGPTASRKTEIAVQLVSQFPFEIISVDSAMVYRGMDIGTAKPSPEILRIAPHRLINIRDPKEIYSAAEFVRDATYEIEDILAKGRIPLLVGGTMLYFKALQKGLAELPKADANIRLALAEEGAKIGWQVLHQRLHEVDPKASKRIHPHDSQRIQRALEVYMLTGKPISVWQDESTISADWEIVNIIMAPHSRQILHDNIAKRFKQMLAEGFVDEVKRLYLRCDLDLTLPSIRSVGYHEIWEYLQGKLSYQQMEEKAVAASRQLAKRQLTWLRKWPNAVWCDSTAPDLYSQVVGILRRFGL